MENNIDIVLSLGSGESVSALKKTVYEEELKEINEKHPLKENEIDIQGTYFLKNEDFLDVGAFIRNGLEKEISLEDMKLIISDETGNILISKMVNLKEAGIVPAKSAIPIELKFHLVKEIEFDPTKQYSLRFGSAEKMEAFSSVTTQVNNLQDNMPFELEKAIKEFERTLPTLKANDFSISLYKLGYNRNREITCMLLLRNGHRSEANLSKLPVSIYNGRGRLIARNVFADEESLIKVEPESSKLLTLTFPPDSVLTGIVDLDKCRVEFK